MNKKIISNFIFLFLLMLSVSFTSSAIAHKAKKHKTLVCIPKEERTKSQLSKDKWAKFFHRLSKLQQDCAILKIVELEGMPVVNCGNIDYTHISSASTSLRNDNKKNAEKIGKIKKGDELLLIQESDDYENWVLVKVRIDDERCAEGYILAKFALLKGEDGKIPTKELIDIKEPSWEEGEEGKLILVDAEGNQTLKGVVGDGKIDKIVVNDEEEVILDDNSFKAQVFVPNDGIEVRIIGYKNKQIVKKLIFTVKVGN